MPWSLLGDYPRVTDVTAFFPFEALWAMTFPAEVLAREEAAQPGMLLLAADLPAVTLSPFSLAHILQPLWDRRHLSSRPQWGSEHGF